MARFLAELDAVSPAIARRLVAPLFQERFVIINGAVVLVGLGILCFVATFSPWYLAGALAPLFPTMWRLWLSRAYARAPDSASPRAWALRVMWASWTSSSILGAWGTAVLFEPDRALMIMIIGVHASIVLGSAVRNNSVPTVPIGQALIIEVPTFVAFLLSDHILLRIFSGFIVLNTFTAVSLCKTLHRQTLRLLQSDETNARLAAETADLAARLIDLNHDLESKNKEMAAVNKSLETLVATDALTGAANRFAFDLELAREWRRAAREKAPLALLMIDVDHFKNYNDTYGHPEGDACLRAFAAAIMSAASRPGDLTARYGGEEFAVILPNTWPDGAARVGEQILAALAARAMPHAASPIGIVSASLGVACVIPCLDTMPASLVQRADAALYRAKQGGRNQLHVASMAGEAVPAVD